MSTTKANSNEDWIENAEDLYIYTVNTGQIYSSYFVPILRRLKFYLMTSQSKTYDQFITSVEGRLLLAEVKKVFKQGVLSYNREFKTNTEFSNEAIHDCAENWLVTNIGEYWINGLA